METGAKRAVVTGAGSGIGAAIARHLADLGWHVVVADVNTNAVAEVAASIGAAAHFAHCDVADHASVEKLADFARSAMGGADLVFANAGVSLSGPLIDASPEQFDWIMAINLRGVWSTASVFARQMRATGVKGAICLTGSEHSLGLQHTGAGVYTATKHGVLALGEVMRAELAPDISVSVLCPGLVATAIHQNAAMAPGHQPDPATDALVSALFQRGKDADQIARTAVAGTLAGDFIIPTHGSSVLAARRRAEEVEGAFARHAPFSESEMQFDVNTVVQSLLAQAGEGDGQ